MHCIARLSDCWRLIAVIAFNLWMVSPILSIKRLSSAIINRYRWDECQKFAIGWFVKFRFTLNFGYFWFYLIFCWFIQFYTDQNDYTYSFNLKIYLFVHLIQNTNGLSFIDLSYSHKKKILLSKMTGWIKNTMMIRSRIQKLLPKLWSNEKKKKQSELISNIVFVHKMLLANCQMNL